MQQEGLDFDPRLLAQKVRGTTYLEGYWQSEGYFKDREATIRSDLRLQRPTDAVNSTIAASIRDSEAVAVHVRYYDAHSPASLADYYRRALGAMEALVHGPHYFVFSDRPADARSCIDLPGERVTYVSHNKDDTTAYADLWLMSQCKHFIIANSTFSWWGAWLSDHRGKQVIAPGRDPRPEAAAWAFAGLFPPSWRILEVQGHG